MNDNSRRALYLVAGVYLVYLGGKLVWQFLKGIGGNPAVSIIGGVVFLFAGIFLVVDYIRYKKREFLQKGTKQELEIDVIKGEKKDSKKSEE